MNQVQNVQRVVVVNVQNLKSNFVVVLAVIVIKKWVEAFKESQKGNFGSVMALRHVQVEHLGEHGRVGSEHLRNILDHLLLGHKKLSFGNG
jgi:hypothetical protein